MQSDYPSSGMTPLYNSARDSIYTLLILVKGSTLMLIIMSRRGSYIPGITYGVDD